MRLLYLLASYLLFWALFPVLLLHRKTRGGLSERLGLYRRGQIPQGGSPRIWLHGASAGDLLALSPMIGRLKRRFPGCAVILSTTTDTGYLMAQGRLRPEIDAAVYWPYDLWGATRRAVRAIRPDVLVLEYTEIWPNLIRAARRSGARVVLTNGRFSPRQVPRYRALFAAISNPLREIDLFLMREEEEAERALVLGAPRERVMVTGNTKFDALAAAPAEEDRALKDALGIPEGAPVLIAGSTHEGEEEKLLEVYRRLKEPHPALRLVIAPRYIDRAPRVLQAALQQGLSAGLRSRGNPGGAEVVVLDTIGELARAYRLATLVFVGGSFTTRGGQNILEPAAQGRPVLFGPHMENFRDSVQVLVGRGGIQVNDPDHLHRILSELLDRPEAIRALGELAQAAVRQVSGASDRNVEMLERLLSPGASAPARPRPLALIVHPHLHRRRTGVTGHVEAVVGALDASGHEARALGSLLSDGVPRARWGALWARLGAGPAVWHAHRNAELLLGLVLRWARPGLKVAFTRHSSRPPSWPTRALARRADLRVALTEESAAAFGMGCAVVGHGVDLRRFQPPPDRPAAFRALGLGGEHGVGVVGRVRPAKGQEDFARAVGPLLERFPAWTAVLVGEAKRRERRWAKSLEPLAAGRLRRAGVRQDVAPWYQGLTVVVQPSREEAFSLVPLEAMASGCCVVASALPYARLVLEHGRTGFLYPPGDVEALRAVLAELLASPGRALSMGRAAAEEARARFGVEREARALAEAYGALFGPGAGAG